MKRASKGAFLVLPGNPKIRGSLETGENNSVVFTKFNLYIYDVFATSLYIL